MEYHITLPSKPRVVSEDDMQGIYEIDSLYPGYGHTLGNSLRRIILSSLPGAAITQVKIEDVPHEFATVDGVRETIMEVLLNLKRIHLVLHGDEPQTIMFSVKGACEITAKDFKLPSQVEVMNPKQHIADLAGSNTVFKLEATVERGLGYVAREMLTKEKVDIGTIALDATFTPIRRVNYEVENMRVGNRTDFNRLRIFIETNGTIAPREALEQSIEAMIHQLKAIIGFQETDVGDATIEHTLPNESATESANDLSKMKITDLGLSTRVTSILEFAGVKSVAGLARKSPTALAEIEGIGGKAVEEIITTLAAIGISLRNE